MKSLGSNHGFPDGNKPTAFAASDSFLRINGFYLDVVAKKGMSSSLAQWIDTSLGLPRSSAGREHIKKLTWPLVFASLMLSGFSRQALQG